MEKHLQQHLHRLRHRLHHHPTGHPALLVSGRPDCAPLLVKAGHVPPPSPFLSVLTILSLPPGPQDPALHRGVPTGALPRLLRLLLLQFHDGSATGAAYLLGLPHFAHGPQVHNWKGEGAVPFTWAWLALNCRMPTLPPAGKLPSKLWGPGCGWNKPAQRPPLAGLWTSNNPASLFPQQVEDERSDREETESSEGEEPAAGGGAKSRPLANGHPILNNHHRKND